MDGSRAGSTIWTAFAVSPSSRKDRWIWRLPTRRSTSGTTTTYMTTAEKATSISAGRANGSKGVVRALKPNGTFWLAIGDEYAAELKVLCTRELGLHCRSWGYLVLHIGVHCTQKFTRSHAHLLCFVKDPQNFTFNSLAIRVPSARELVYGDKRADPNGRVPDDTWLMTPLLPAEVPTKGRFRVAARRISPSVFPPHSDTWYFSRVAGTFAERRGLAWMSDARTTARTNNPGLFS